MLSDALTEQGGAAAEHAASSTDPATVFLSLFGHVQAHKIFGFTNASGEDIFVVTNHTILQLIAFGLAFFIFYNVAKRVGQTGRPKGVFCNMFESVVLYVRDEMVGKFLHKEHADKLLPLFLTFFVFILFCNLIGLIPIPGIGGTATANIAVTCALALITLVTMIGGGMAVIGPTKFWTGLVPHGIPAFVIPLMFVIEVVGLFIKAFALTIRLFANMVAGHLVILSFFGLVILFKAYSIMVPAVVMAVFITLLEVLVAFIQAYVFTFLSILFVSMCIQPDH